MDKNDLKQRTKKFALDVIKLSELIPKTEVGRIVIRQLIRSATSVAANYRAACRARSKEEFVAKLGTVIEEADESIFWLEILIEGSLLKQSIVAPILQEAHEITAIMVSSSKSARKNLKSKI
jgi:four helix bundle protein